MTKYDDLIEAEIKQSQAGAEANAAIAEASRAALKANEAILLTQGRLLSMMDKIEAALNPKPPSHQYVRWSTAVSALSGLLASPADGTDKWDNALPDEESIAAFAARSVQFADALLLALKRERSSETPEVPQAPEPPA